MSTNNKEHCILIAGFGGQGVVLAGNVLAYAALEVGKNLLATVSYGAEMRGGTAKANITISDQEIDSPIIENANIAMIMNAPSFVKYIPTLQNGSIVIMNSSMIDPELAARKDLEYIGVDATNMAIKMGNIKVANIIMLGALISRTKILDDDAIIKGMGRAFRKDKKGLFYINKNAYEQGRDMKLQSLNIT
jgi:2-oxoglutarate ferredoxin oxidoreductase subunit gamma